MHFMIQEEKNLFCQIVDIYEDEFGCEGRPDGQEAMVTIVLKDEKGEKHFVRMPDQTAYDWELTEGDSVELDTEGKIKRQKNKTKRSDV